ncbi:MAG: glyoxalase [Nocardiaceae bacterium]|nr:glyoxalase [Nocardiaceae bacterium]
MTSIESVILETPDVAGTEAFYAALGLDDKVSVRATEAQTQGFRGYTISLVATQPANVDALFNAAVSAGATVLKPASKSFWGYGGVVQAPDGAIWKVASSSKKNTEPASKQVTDTVLLLGVEDVAATKKFYLDKGLSVAKSFGKKYVEFASNGNLKLALYGRKALAKDAGVPAEGDGSHRLVISSSAGTFADPDGFAWESA